MSDVNPPEQRPFEPEPEPGNQTFPAEPPAGAGAPPPPPPTTETAPLQPAFGASPPSGQGPGVAGVTPPAASSEPLPPPPATGPASAGGYGGTYAAAPGGPATPGPGPAPAQGLTAGMGGGGGFLEALFDYGFNTFVTPKIVKFVYVLATIWVAIVYVLYVVAAFTDSVSYGIIVLVMGALFAFIWLAIVRIALEFAISVVRMSEDVHKRLPQA